MLLGQFLRDLRGDRSAKEVYEALGVPKPTFYMWEGPRSRPDPTDLKRLLDFYGVDADQELEAFRLRSEPLDEPAVSAP